jgi:hypothetical protein|tara:strand:+ start:2540 stop:2695 length:156 start_codon:yes stop_codon:yes gene_type:complete
MPTVKGKKFPYTKKGITAAKKAAGYEHGGSVNMDSPAVPQRKRLAAGYKIT